MNTTRLQVFGVISPGDVAQLGVDPFAAVELGELGAQPAFGVDLSGEALGAFPSVEPVVAGTPWRGSFGPVLDPSSHRTVSYMEERCSQSRLGFRFQDRDGTRRFTTRQVRSEGYVAAGFDHFTSRANDPQVHTHVVVINRVWAEGGWRAIDAKAAYGHAKAGGTIYQAALRSELTERLGVAWQPVVDGLADVAGFSPELIRHFSTRRVEIEVAVERYVAETGKEAHPRVWQTFTLETRQPKAHPRGEAAVTQEMKDYGITTDVVEHWNRRAHTAPENVEEVVRAAVGVGPRTPPPPGPMAGQVVERVVAEITDRRAVFTERDLIPFAAALYPGVGPGELVASTRQLVESAERSGEIVRLLPHSNPPLQLPDGIRLSNDEFVLLEVGPLHATRSANGRLGGLPGEARYTTRLQLEREQHVLDAVARPTPVSVDGATLEEAITRRDLVAEQAEAIRHLAGLDGRVVAVAGPGGSGKTHAIGAYADAAQAAGHPVVGVATSATAARRLGEELASSWSGTIAMMRHQLDQQDGTLQPGTVVVVDEASMVSTRDLAWLVEQADNCAGKVVLVGDPSQLPSVDSGGLFGRIVTDGHGVVTDLAELNQRQHLDVDRTALRRFRAGEVEQAVRGYAEAGRVHLGHDEYATKAAMVDAWWHDAQANGLESVRMLASRRDEVAMLNQFARVHMTRTGQLTGPVLANRWGSEFQTGDRIVVRDNWYAHSDLRNGQTGTITTIDPDTGGVVFHRDADRAVIGLPKAYVDRSVDHAYAQTIHTAQGQTFQSAHIYLDAGIAGEHGYTALSRARNESHLWVNHTRDLLGDCPHPHGAQVPEDHLNGLVRQLTRSVLEPPATAQGVPVSDATDSQLYQWQQELADRIRTSPLTDRADHTDLLRCDQTIAEARNAAEQVGTTGTRRQVEDLETKRDQLVERITARESWVEDNPDILHSYSAVTDELQHRITARVLSYQLDPPTDVLEALGPRPDDKARADRWDAAVAHHAEAQMRLGTEADLTDPAVLEAASWRHAINEYHPQPELTQKSVLQLTG
ncbi:MAG: MobF family relaxase [Acidimicrobiia bacterium]